jgi:tetratricopeptide (TPR) repeat protein
MRFLSISFLGFSFLILALFNTLTFADDAELNKKIADCNQYIKNGTPEKALDSAGQLLKKNQKNREVVLCKARAQMALNQFADAVPTLTTVDKLSNTPNEHMMSLAMLGNAYKGNQQFNEAIASYQQSMDIAKAQKNKSFERITYNLVGEAQALTKQFEEAITSYQAGLKLALNDNERADAFERIASIYNQQQKHNQAIEYQLKATLAYTHYGDLDAQANAGLELGRIYMDAGELEQAEKSINKMLKLAVDNGGAYWEVKSDLYLAKVKMASHQSNDAKKLLESAQKLNKEVGDAMLSEAISAALKELAK